MKASNALLLLFALAIFCSCQKEIPDIIEGEPLPPPSSNDLLYKTIAVQSHDTTSSEYVFNTEGDVIESFYSSLEDGETTIVHKIFDRDEKGRITLIKELVSGSFLSGAVVDTSYSKVYYPDAETFNFNTLVTIVSADGEIAKDSILYTYDAQNRLAEQFIYRHSSFAEDRQLKVVFYYDANGNVTSIKNYELFQGNFEQSLTVSFEFDDKPNAFTGFRQYLLTVNQQFGESKNNITKMTYNDNVSPEANTVISSAYTYGSNNKPLTQTATQPSENTVTNISYFYK